MLLNNRPYPSHSPPHPHLAVLCVVWHSLELFCREKGTWAVSTFSFCSLHGCCKWMKWMKVWLLLSVWLLVVGYRLYTWLPNNLFLVYRPISQDKIIIYLEMNINKSFWLNMYLLSNCYVPDTGNYWAFITDKLGITKLVQTRKESIITRNKYNTI